MAIVNSTKSGVWSDTTLWSTSALPLSADNVIIFHTVTANINTRVSTISPGCADATTCFLFLSSNVSLSADIFVNVSNFIWTEASSFVVYNQTFPSRTELVGNLYGVATRNIFRNTTSGIVDIRGNLYGYPLDGSRVDGYYTNRGTLNVFGNINPPPFFGGFNSNRQISIIQNHSAVNIFGNVFTVDDPDYAAFSSPTVASIDNIGANAICNVVGSIIAQRSNTTSQVGYGILNRGTNSVVNITGGVIGGTSGLMYGVYNNSSGCIVNLFGSVSGVASNCYGIFNNSGRVFVYGESRGGIGSGAHGVYNNSNTGYVFVRKAVGNGFGAGSAGATIYPAFGTAAGLFNNAISGTCVVGSIECGLRGQFPTTGNIYLCAGNLTNATFTDGAGRLITLYLPGSASTYTPLVSDVRLNTVYDQNKRMGTLAIPLTSQVNFGVPLDNTLGGAVFDSNTVFSIKPSTIRLEKNSIGERISFLPTIKLINNTISNLS